jgi:signal transduction histidine kinase
MMRSIQSRLTVALCAASILFSVVVGLLLHRAIGQILVRGFDHTLQDKARALSSLVARELNGRLEFEYTPAIMPEFQRTEHAEYFEIRFADGRLYHNSKSLHSTALPSFIPGNSAHDITLPSGRAGRLITMPFFPRQEDEIEPTTDDPDEQWRIPAGEQMVVTLARDRAELDGGLRELNESLIFGTIGLAAVIALAAILIARRALAPLRLVAEQAAQIDATQLDRRFPTSAIPVELLPICSRLNDLLVRLEAAFHRERRFTSDVAHELRTPIAELRSVAEVALKWPDDIEASRHAIRDAHAIARQMETLVNVLLAFVRSSSGEQRTISVEPVWLLSTLKHVASLLETTSPARAIQMSVPAEVVVLAESSLLASVFTNLLSNAIEYAANDTPVSCRAEMVDNRWTLSIENQTHDLHQQDLSHLFEPFWRKDTARTGVVHSGLGLALVSAYCRLMEIDLAAEMPRADLFQIKLTFPPLPPSDHPPFEVVSHPTAQKESAGSGIGNESSHVPADSKQKQN